MRSGIWRGWQDVLARVEDSGEWGFLKLLQDAKVGDRIYAGKFSLTSYFGTIECYDRSKHGPISSGFPEPIGGVVLATPREVWHLRQFFWGKELTTPPYWYYLNANFREPVYTTNTGSAYLPDYVLAKAGPDFNLGVFLGFGGGGMAIVDRYGYVYLGAYAEAGVGLPIPLSFEVTMGWVYQNGLLGRTWLPGPVELKNFIEGWGAGVSANLFMYPYGVGGSVNIADDFPRSLFEEAVGGENTLVGLPSADVGIDRVWQLSFLGPVSWLAWDWIDKYPLEHGYQRQDIQWVDDRPNDCGC